jgi:DNA recombination protein RmuC
MLEILFGILALFVLIAFVWLGLKLTGLTRLQQELPELIEKSLEDKHRAMLNDLHAGLAAQSERLTAALIETSERLRSIVAEANPRRHSSTTTFPD